MGAIWSKSGQVEFDNNGVVAGACEARFFVGGTTTPLTVYSDAAETTPRAVPAVADANGRWPVTFIPFTAAYDVQVTTEGGTQLYYYTNIPNPDPVEASEDSVDAAELIATGHVHWEPIAGTKAGYVRANGRTIGNASSSATERANADTEDLFTYLWNGLANGQAAVSGGRGANAAADYAANKNIAVPDLRSAFLAGLDDMGNSALGQGYVGSFWHGNATTAGSAGGANTYTLVTADMPAHTHSFSATTGSDGSHSHSGTTGGQSQGHTHAFAGTTSVENQDHTHNTNVNATNSSNAIGAGGPPVGPTSSVATYTSTGVSNTHVHSYSGTTDANNVGHTHDFTTSTSGSHTHTVSGTSGSTGGGGAHNNMPKHFLGTFYLKL